MHRGCQSAFVLLSTLASAAISLPGFAGAETLVFHASQSGRETLDQGEGGGNPFASALIELLGQSSVRLGELPAVLRQLTVAKSRNFQSPDVPSRVAPPDWSVIPPNAGEVRRALVVVVSDYAKSGGAQSLPGAKLDADRVAAALTKAGFATEIAIDLDLPGMRRRLEEFTARTNGADAAAIYTTGHGVEVGGEIYLVPGDYPIALRNKGLRSRALPLAEISKAVQAKRVNLVFYGGCRNDPLGE